MLIKDRIMSQLKNRFIEEINNTIRDGNEHGFLICKDEKGKLSTTQSCQGTECTVSLESLKFQCPIKIQGDFHTHPHAAETKRYLKEQLGRDVELDITKKLIIELAKSKNMALEGLSHGDLLGTIGLRYQDKILGTTCVGTDIKPDEVVCWSTKNGIKEKEAFLAAVEIHDPNIDEVHREWTRSLFDIEKIDLKNDNLKGDENNGR